MSKNESFEANINENNVSNATFEELFAVPFGNRLNFNHHISNICKMTSNNLHALARVSYYMGQDKSRIPFNSI